MKIIFYLHSLYSNFFINNLETADIDETIGATEQKNVFRKDEIVEFKTREELLQNAPSQDEGMFRIPKVIN